MRFKLVVLWLFVSISCMPQSKDEISHLIKGTWEIEKIIIDGEENFTTLSGKTKSSDMKIIFKDDKILDFYQKGIHYENLNYSILKEKEEVRLNFASKNYKIKIQNDKLYLIDDSLFVTEYILRSSIKK